MRIIETKTIYRDEEYVSFPNLAKLKDGTIMCAFRHAPERQKEYGGATHIDPGAKDVFILSHDGGKTFDPELHTILDEEMVSNQDPCITVLSDGRIIASAFRWLLAPRGKAQKSGGKNGSKPAAITSLISTTRLSAKPTAATPMTTARPGRWFLNFRLQVHPVG